MIEDEKRISTIYSRIQPSLERALNVACAERGVKRPDAIEEAIQRWVALPANAGVENQHNEFPKTLTCPACESVISVGVDHRPKVLENKSVPRAEQGFTGDVSESTLLESSATPDELSWVKKLLYVLRGDAETAGALMNNLDRFELLAQILAGDYGKADRTARPVPADQAARMARIREIGERYRRDRGTAGSDEERLSPGEKRGSTGTEGGGKD